MDEQMYPLCPKATTQQFETAATQKELVSKVCTLRTGEATTDVPVFHVQYLAARLG